MTVVLPGSPTPITGYCVMVPTRETYDLNMTIDQALQLLAQLPADADFLATTNFTRSQWELMLTEMRKW